MTDRQVLALLATGFLILSNLAVTSQPAVAKKEANAAKKTVNGEKVFSQLCASCHVAGGNKVNPAKPLAGSEKLKSLVSFKDYLRNPLGHMPYYKHVVTDKKTLEALYKYCKELSPSQQSMAPIKSSPSS